MNTILFEEALGEEDEYQRLQKITEAIKQVAGAIMRIESFNNSQLIKFMICSYPFQQEAIKLLMNTIFDYFQDFDFLNAFQRALLEIAELQEQRVFLSSRSSSLRIGMLQQQYSLDIISQNNFNIRKEQNKQGAIPFSKSVIESLTAAKRFAASFIQRYLELAKSLGDDLKERIFIIKNFVTGTKDHHLIIVLINIFEDLKLNVLKDQHWVAQFDKEIELYCQQHNIIIPHYVDKMTNAETSNNIPDSEVDSYSSEEEQSNQKTDSNISGGRSEIEEKELLLNLLIQKNPKIDQKYNEILQKNKSQTLLFNYVLNPNIEEIENCWSQFDQLEKPEDQEKITYKIRLQQIDFHKIVRSYKTTQMLTSKENLERMLSIKPTFLQDLFSCIYDSFLDEQRNFNLNHVAIVIDSCLSMMPRNTMIRILENRMLFILSNYIYNPFILGLLIDIHFIQIDKYGFGLQFQEIIWKHQLHTNWFQYLLSIFINQERDQKFTDKNNQSATIDQFVINSKQLGKQEIKNKFKPIQNEAKIKLTEMFGSLQSAKSLFLHKQTDFEDWKHNLRVEENLTLKEFNQKDYDNLKEFIKCRDYHYKEQMEEKIQAELQLQIDNLQNKRNFRIRLPIPSHQSHQSPNLSGRLSYQTPRYSQHSSQQNSSNSSIKLPTIQSTTQSQDHIYIRQSNLSTFAFTGETEQKLRNSSQLGSSQQQSKLVIASSRRLRTDADQPLPEQQQRNSNNGFPSSRLVTIYPTKQALIKLEKSQLVLKADQTIIRNCLTFYKEILFSILEYFCQPNKTNLQQLNESILIQEILSMNFMNHLFELYLSSSIDDQLSQQKIGEQCGQLINFIYGKCQDIEIFDLVREQLKTIFMSNIDFLTSAIVTFNKQTQQTIKQANKYQQLLLLTTYSNGFNLFSICSQVLASQNIYKHLNETVMHIFIIWFFDSNQSNQYQHFFVKFLAIIFSKAPIQSLTNILFNLGLVNSIYNALSSFYINGIRSETFKAGIYFYMLILVYVIDKALKHRNIVAVLDYLQPLHSWKGIYHLIPDVESNLMIELQELLKTGQTPIRKIEFNKNVIQKLKTQLTIELNDNKQRELRQFELQQQNIAEKNKSGRSTPNHGKRKQQKHRPSVQKSYLIKNNLKK